MEFTVLYSLKTESIVFSQARFSRERILSPQSIVYIKNTARGSKVQYIGLVCSERKIYSYKLYIIYK